ncbi:hypothetical protein LTR78_000686 [Recurvomyces mirabilis]|uniref:Uncharacterized protein n=1 Tax=Recurvomyces mirabilis TaxID=574656 RepID=A0AAE0WVJ0_9PEZI|nr:hypothetical protein LTR78_000686 [Recurvomyces mirabilis]KAK5158657.1 hypothetical protein LTS14_002764 [Recurvomyces mirabilis]
MAEEEEDESQAEQRSNATGTATQDHAAPDMPETRRTSTSSMGRETPSMQASQASGFSESVRRQRPRPLDYGSTSGSNRLQQTVSPQPTTPKRPGAKRQPSHAAPHRGDMFSVDDDPNELENDLQRHRTRTKRDEQRERQERQQQSMRRQQSTLRRRPTAPQPAPQLTTVDSEDREEDVRVSGNDAAHSQADGNGDPSSEETLQGEEEEEEPPTPEDDEDENEDDDDADLSDAESFTLKDRQEAINETHPFGIRIWKPALYKKSRSVQRNAEGDIHSAPGGNVSRWLGLFNFLWTIVFGWWLSLLAGVGGVINLALYLCLGFESCHDYGRVLINLAHYLFYPFGKFVKLEYDEAYLDEDEGEGRSISEYERWQTGDLEEGRLFFGPTSTRSIIGQSREEVEDLDPPADETDALLGRPARQSSVTERAQAKTKKRLFGRGEWNLGRVIFFLSFYFLLTPFLFLVSGICWFLVFTIPMGKVTLLIFYHLRRHPLALSFHTDSHYGRGPNMPRGDSGSSILLCTYRAVGLKYWKYTIDGTNIFLINLLGLVFFAIFDYFLLYEALGIRTWLTSPGLVFVLALASIIPLAYFIGQAVASISAQSSMGVGATINAFFSTVVEVFLYCVALKQGKAKLVEGSIIGSIFAGILFLPGLSMCFGALKRKTQRFNVRSAGVTSTMLLFAVIGAFGPTLFYQIYGSHELNCHQCLKTSPGEDPEDRDCRRCFFAQVPAIHDRFFIEAVRPYIYFAAVCLFFSYVVGLLFTLRTHAAVIWNNEPDEKKDAKMDEAMKKYEERHGVTAGAMASLSAQMPDGMNRPGMARGETTGTMGSVVTVTRENIRDSQMYKRILNQSLRQAALAPGQSQSQSLKKKPDGDSADLDASPIGKDQQQQQTPHMVPPKSSGGDAESVKSIRIHGLSSEDNRALVQQMAEVAATAATVAARDATRAPRKAMIMSSTGIGPPKGHGHHHHHNSTESTPALPAEDGTARLPPVPETTPDKPAEAAGGHDAPNWSRTKSAIILLTATLAYAIIAEILVDTVDAVLSNITIDEKFLGITLFALVPNTTEFLNAISFAMNGNVALSMEIGSSYALQVMLLQIPCLVLFSAVYARFFSPFPEGAEEAWVGDHTFSMIFPQWDMVTVILGVFLMGWVVGEGKSNYFKGSTLILTYLVVAVGFWFSGFVDTDTVGPDRFELAGLGLYSETFKTVGRGSSGRAY